MARTKKASDTRVVTEAVVLRRFPQGDADWSLTLATKTLGVCDVSARGARRVVKGRSPAVLDGFHRLKVELSERQGWLKLVRSEILQDRLGLLQSLRRLEGAGQFLRDFREVMPQREPDSAGWSLLNGVLDSYCVVGSQEQAAQLEIYTHMRLAALMGYGLDLDACGRCGRLRPEGRSAMVAQDFSGLRCRGCAGGPWLLKPVDIALLQHVPQSEPPEVDPARLRAMQDFVRRRYVHLLAPSRSHKFDERGQKRSKLGGGRAWPFRLVHAFATPSRSVDLLELGPWG